MFAMQCIFKKFSVMGPKMKRVYCFHRHIKVDKYALAFKIKIYINLIAATKDACTYTGQKGKLHPKVHHIVSTQEEGSQTGNVEE